MAHVEVLICSSIIIFPCRMGTVSRSTANSFGLVPNHLGGRNNRSDINSSGGNGCTTVEGVPEVHLCIVVHHRVT